MHQPIEIELKFMRLNSGEDIVTEVQTLNDKTYRIINPLKIVYYYNENVGVMSMSLVPWIFSRITDNNNYDMEKHNVLVSSNLSTAMVKSYYGILNKINSNMYMVQKEPNDKHEDDDEYNEEDFDDKAIEETKEMLNDIIKKRYH